MTLIGFAIAFVLTLIGGWLADGTGWIVMSLVPALVFMVGAFGALGRQSQFSEYQ